MRGAVIALVLLVVVALGSVLGHGDPELDGQVVFVPTSTTLDEVSPGTGPLQIRECIQRPGGLFVAGNAQGVSPVVTVLVSADGSTGVGVRVGRGFAYQAQLPRSSTVGDFEVTLPFADESALFAVREDGSSSRVVSGVGCPGH